MDVATARALANLQARVKRLENSYTNTETNRRVNISALSLPRDDVNLSECGIEDSAINESPLLGSLYGSETKALSKFCVGTYPDDTFLKQSVIVHGGQTTPDDQPNEYMRMVIYPSFIKSNIPFTNIQVRLKQKFFLLVTSFPFFSH